MPYYVLQRGPQELYATNMTLNEDEERRYGNEGQMSVVTAIFVWTSFEGINTFRQFLSIEQGNPNSPFRELTQDMRAGKVDALELSAVQLRDQLRTRHARRAGFVAIDPGPEQRVRKIDEFLAELPA